MANDLNEARKELDRALSEWKEAGRREEPSKLRDVMEAIETFVEAKLQAQRSWIE